MVVNEHLEEKCVAIWISNHEKRDERIQENIRKIIDENHKKKIQTVIFYSGKENLQELTGDLLEHAAKKHRPNQTIDRESIDLFTTMWYNYLKGIYPFNEVEKHDQGTDA